MSSPRGDEGDELGFEQTEFAVPGCAVAYTCQKLRGHLGSRIRHFRGKKALSMNVSISQSWQVDTVAGWK